MPLWFMVLTWERECEDCRAVVQWRSSSDSQSCSISHSAQLSFTGVHLDISYRKWLAGSESNWFSHTFYFIFYTHSYIWAAAEQDRVTLSTIPFHTDYDIHIPVLFGSIPIWYPLSIAVSDTFHSIGSNLKCNETRICEMQTERTDDSIQVLSVQSLE